MATAAEIQQLYVIYFGRPADPDGLDFWLSKTTLTAQQIANAFGSTPEYQTRLSNLGTSGAINQIYLNSFGRSPDAAGLQFWTQKVQTGQLSLATAGFIIANNASPADQAIIANKQVSAGLYTTNIRLSTQSVLAYTTASGLNSGTSFLSGITTTAATSASAASAVATMTTAAGGGTGGLVFSAVSNNAVLTNAANINGNGTGPGFTPSASTLTNANDIVRFGVFQGATIQDGSSSDGDTLILDTTGFAQGATVVAGIETINFNGAASFSAGTVAGVRTVNFNQAGNFLNGLSGASTASVFVATTGTVGLIGGASQASLNITLSAVNLGTLSLNSTTALTITNANTANASYNLSFSAAAAGAGTLAFNAGSINALSINNPGLVAFSAATFSAAGDFTLTLGSAGAGISAGDGFANANSAVVSFATTGQVRVIERGSIYSANSLNHLGWSNVSAWQFGGSTAALNATAQQFSAGVPLKNGTVDLSFGTAQTTAAFIYFSDSTANTINTYIAGGTTGNTLAIGGTASTAFFATGATDTVNLTFNTLSGVFLMSGAGIGLNAMDATLSGFTAFTANLGIEVLSLNILGGTSTQNHIINAVTTSTATTTFNLNAAQSVVFRVSGFTQAGSGLAGFGFSAADGNNTINITTGWTQGSVLGFFDGSGNSFISLNNLANAQAIGASVNFGTAYTAFATQISTINISDGGSDVIALGGSTALSAFTRAQVIGFAAGDVLSFTNYSGTLNSFQVVTSLSAVATVGTSAVALFSDGSNTYVFQNTTGDAGAGVTGATTANTLAAVLLGGNFASLGRWTLNANNLTLIS